MTSNPRILDPSSEEYFQLKVCCQLFEELTDNMRFKIENIYFDAGQDWMWTTVVAYNDITGEHFQCLSPREWNEIISDAANSTIRQICRESINEYPRLYNFKKENQ